MDPYAENNKGEIFFLIQTDEILPHLYICFNFIKREKKELVHSDLPPLLVPPS
jgi:hypothetical protein